MRQDSLENDASVLAGAAIDSLLCEARLNEIRSQSSGLTVQLAASAARCRRPGAGSGQRITGYLEETTLDCQLVIQNNPERIDPALQICDDLVPFRRQLRESRHAHAARKLLPLPIPQRKNRHSWACWFTCVLWQVFCPCHPLNEIRVKSPTEDKNESAARMGNVSASATADNKLERERFDGALGQACHY